MKRTQTLALAAVLVAVMLVLGYVESLYSLSAVPGVKLGLSNCVLLLALYRLPTRVCFAMMLAKVLLLGFLFGNPMMILYSLAGGALSLAAMAALRHLPRVSPVGVGMAGGALHNLAQVAVAALVLQTPSVLSYLAVLLPVGACAGALTGGLAAALQRREAGKNGRTASD